MTKVEQRTTPMANRIDIGSYSDVKYDTPIAVEIVYIHHKIRKPYKYKENYIVPRNDISEEKRQHQTEETN